jgi:hypothetical protein
VSFKKNKILTAAVIKDECGQSTIEFILTFSISLIVLFLFVKVAYIMVDGYIIHYATFAASRSYLVYDTGRADPAGADNQAFSKSKGLFKLYVKNASGLKVNTPESGKKSIYTGVYYEYKTSFTTANIVGGKKGLKLRSESFLGREPTAGEAYLRTCAAIQISGGRCGEYTTIFDNGG